MSWINIKIWTISTKFHYPYEWIFGAWSWPTYIIKEATWSWYINLTNAVANHLIELKAYGWTEQNLTPTPTTPVNIVCNNGTLKVKDSELPVWYKRVLWYACNNDVLWQITNFHLRGSDTVRISFSVTTGCNVFGCYQGTDANDNYDLYVSVSSNAKYLRYGNGTYLSYWSNNDLWERFDVVFTPTWTTWMPTDSTWTPMTFESANDLLLAATTLTGTSSKLKWNLYGNFVVDWRLKLIPCERLSDNSLWYYDTYSDTFFEPTGAPTSLWYDYTYTPEIYTDWTTETIEDELWNTATAEMLLKIWDYADEQEILSWNIIRKVGYKIFNWKESFTTSTAYWKACLVQSAASGWGAVKYNVLCTHFKGLPVSGWTQPDYTCFFNASWHFYFRLEDNTVATFKQWLTDQYNAWTPVIVFYVLAEETTETVTGQTMDIQAWSNTIEITQASINNLWLYAKYKATA